MTARRATPARLAIVAALLALVGVAEPVHGQTPAADGARCDSIVAAARVDSMLAGVFVSVGRVDGDLERTRTELMAASVGAAFVPPRPFRLSVFSGPPRMRLLRTRTDTAPVRRAPTVTGVYRFMVDSSGHVSKLVIVRMSLMPGFDSSATEAIRQAGGMEGVMAPPQGEDSMRLEVRFSTDSSPGSRRIITASFPLMPVVDAVPVTGNPAADFPADAARDSITEGEVVLRFVVDRTGAPIVETLELLRATDMSFLKAAVAAVPSQRFAPATIAGCAVSQRVEYPFSFVAPADGAGRMPIQERSPGRD